MTLWNRAVLAVGYGALALAGFTVVDQVRPRYGCFIFGHDFEQGVCRFCEARLDDAWDRVP